jgi:phage-related protein
MKPVHFVSSCLNDLRDFPEGARSEAGHAIRLAQQGEKALNAIPMTGLCGASVLEVVIPEDGDAYRAVYTVKFSRAVYALHAFQKKARHGIKTPYHEMDVIRARLKIAERHYRENYSAKEQEKHRERRSRER